MGHEQLHELSAAYALDALDAEEREAFELHLSSCAACREEVAALTETAAALAYAAGSAEPPARLREQVLQRVREDGGVVIPFRRRRVEAVLASGLAVAAAAAVVLAVWAGSLNGKLGNERSARQAGEQAAAVLIDPLAKSHLMSGVDGRVVVDMQHRGVLVLNSLAPPRPGKTYEAWVISGGTPKPAGTFSGGNLVLLTRPVTTGSVVALTEEPSGGSSRPTSSPFASSSRV